MNEQRTEPIFIGDDLAVDFLNSIASPAGEPVEWISDGADLVAWLESAEALPAEVAVRVRTSFTPGELDDVARRARDLREWFRGFVGRHAGKQLGPRNLRALEPINDLLRSDSNFAQIVAGEGRDLRVASVRRWERADSLLLPLAQAIAELASGESLAHVRHCEGSGCTLWFRDTSKAHRRRWCSMAACGNRAKAATYRKRDPGPSDD